MLVKPSLFPSLSLTALALPQVRRTFDVSDVLDTIDTISKESSSIQNILSDFTVFRNRSDSAKVASAVVDLSTAVFSLLDEFVGKKPVFDKAILGVGSASFLVEGDMKKLKTATDEYGDAVTSKLSGDIKKITPLLVGDIDFHFAQAIDAFASKS